MLARVPVVAAGPNVVLPTILALENPPVALHLRDVYQDLEGL